MSPGACQTFLCLLFNSVSFLLWTRLRFYPGLRWVLPLQVSIIGNALRDTLGGLSPQSRHTDNGHQPSSLPQDVQWVVWIASTPVMCSTEWEHFARKESSSTQLEKGQSLSAEGTVEGTRRTCLGLPFEQWLCSQSPQEPSGCWGLWKELPLLLEFAFSFHHGDMNARWQKDNLVQIAQDGPSLCARPV